jgi:hypothetical protein
VDRLILDDHRQARAQVGQADRRPVPDQPLELNKRLRDDARRQRFDGGEPLHAQRALDQIEVAHQLTRGRVLFEQLVQVASHPAHALAALLARLRTRAARRLARVERLL